MLETCALLLGPWVEKGIAGWVRNPESYTRVRLIFRSEDRKLVGFAGEGKLKPSWLFKSRRTWKIFEHEDESLVFTIHFPSRMFCHRKIRDAEGNCIGRIQGDVLKPAHRLACPSAEFFPPAELGALFGTSTVSFEGLEIVCRVRDGKNWNFTPIGENPVAALTLDREETLLTFRDDLKDSPFVKMLLLAAALEMS